MSRRRVQRARVKGSGKSFRDEDVGVALSGISWDSGIVHSIFRRRFALDLKRIDFAFHMEDATQKIYVESFTGETLSPISARFRGFFF